MSVVDDLRKFGDRAARMRHLLFHSHGVRGTITVFGEETPKILRFREWEAVNVLCPLDPKAQPDKAVIS